MSTPRACGRERWSPRLSPPGLSGRRSPNTRTTWKSIPTAIPVTLSGRGGDCRIAQIQPAVALSITDPDRPWRYLEIRGQVELIVPDPEGAEFVRLAERYGMPQGPPADAAERIAVAIRPLHTTTQ